MPAHGTLRVVFMGTPEFARVSLAALLAGPDPVVGVVCQPDRPRGRGLATTPPPVKQLAVAHGLPVLQPERARDPAFLAALEALEPDLIVVAAYGRILPRSILELPPAGCINVHASLLPRHRGAAPIQWAILSGDDETGITIMAMNEEMDAGDILLARSLRIDPHDTAGSLGERLAMLGAACLSAAIADLHTGTLPRLSQPLEGVTFAPRIERAHARIDWSQSVGQVLRRVRAMAPAPGAFTTHGSQVIKIHRAAPGAPGAPAAAGTIVQATPDGLVVACGDGVLRIEELQLEGRRRLTAAAFVAGHPLAPGTCLGSE